VNSDDLQLVCEKSEPIGTVGLDRQRLRLTGVDLEELLQEIARGGEVWKLLDLIDRDVLLDYVDPDGRFANLEDEVEELTDQLIFARRQLDKLKQNNKPTKDETPVDQAGRAQR
jgi:hypothetical protein